MELLAQFADERQEAVRCYVQFVAEGIGKGSIWQDLNRQIYLGDDAFVERMQTQCALLGSDLPLHTAYRAAARIGEHQAGGGS